MRYLFLIIFLNVFSGYSQSYLDFYFKSKGINGAILIYNENKNEWIFNKDEEPFLNTPPAAHYHLWMALVGLQEQVFSTEEKNTIPWDGVKRSYFEERKLDWNSDTNLIQALNTQNDWYFDLLKYQLEEKKYNTSIKTNDFLKEIKNNELDYFWNYGALTNPNTMILFLKDLYENKLPFSKQHQKYVFNSLLIDQKMALRTSSTSYLGKKIDWTIGVYFTKEKPVYFSLRTYRSLEHLDQPDYDKKRNLILSEIFDVLNLTSN